VFNKRVRDFAFGKRHMGWQCTVCGKIFSRTVDEIERDCDICCPEYVEREFRMHGCEIVLVEGQEKQEAEAFSHSCILPVHRE
jgi:predicted  nucleic acid-binding Zn-ribbon protein